MVINQLKMWIVLCLLVGSVAASEGRVCEKFDEIYSSLHSCFRETFGQFQTEFQQMNTLIDDKFLSPSDARAMASLGCRYITKSRTCLQDSLTDCTNYASDIIPLLNPEGGSMCASDGSLSTNLDSAITDFSGITIDDSCKEKMEDVHRGCRRMDTKEDFLNISVTVFGELLQEKMDTSMECFILSIRSNDVSACGKKTDAALLIYVIEHMNAGMGMFLPFDFSTYKITIRQGDNAARSNLLSTILGSLGSL